MKKLIDKTIYILAAICLFFSACEKDGDIVTYPSFGDLEVSGVVSAPLTIEIDGKVAGQLSESNSNKTLKVEEGKRLISLIDASNRHLIDTTITIDRKSNSRLANFLYTGTGILFPDTDFSNNPAPGKVLMRFVILDKSLPDVLNLEIALLDLATFTSTPYKSVPAVNKSGFSRYIELDDPGSEDLVYVIEASDLNGNKVMSVEGGSFGLIFYDSDTNVGLTYIPNTIISLGIGPPPADGSSTFYQPQVIFKRMAK